MIGLGLVALQSDRWECSREALSRSKCLSTTVALKRTIANSVRQRERAERRERWCGELWGEPYMIGLSGGTLE